MPPEIHSELDNLTESEYEFHPIDEIEYFSSDINEFQKVGETDSEVEVKRPISHPIKKRKFVCQECLESFRRKTQFDRHMFKHNGIVSFSKTIYIQI